MMKIFRKANGVTIFESLVVIASLLIIISITLPAYNALKEAGRKTQCLSHLRQYGMALKIYEQDYLFFPLVKDNPTPLGNKEWDELLDYVGYVKKGDRFTLTCPTYTRSNPNPTRTYAMLEDIFYTAGSPALKQTTDIDNSNITILLAEVNNEYEKISSGATGGANAEKEIHSGGANYLFFDGHVGWYKKSNAESELNWDD